MSYTSRSVDSLKRFYDKDPIAAGILTGIMASLPILPAAVLGIVAAADVCRLTGKGIAKVAKGVVKPPSPPNPEQVRRQALAQFVAAYNAKVAEAEKITDADMRNQVLGQLEIDFRERVQQLS